MALQNRISNSRDYLLIFFSNSMGVYTMFNEILNLISK